MQFDASRRLKDEEVMQRGVICKLVIYMCGYSIA